MKILLEKVEIKWCTRKTYLKGDQNKQGFEELYNQRLKEVNIVRQRLYRLKLSRLMSNRQKLHRLKPYKLRHLGWGSPGWSSIGSLGLPVLKIFKLQQWSEAGGGGQTEIIYSSLWVVKNQRKKLRKLRNGVFRQEP